jgi:hypothetical protein
MIRSLVVHDIPADSYPAMERWYYRDHAAEIVRRYGPWLGRHESFVPVPAPPEAQQYGLYDWRVTDAWWREIPLTGSRGAACFTPPPVWPTVATCFIPAQATEDFVGGDRPAHDPACLRWLILLRYPDGVSPDEGDAWFLGVHAPQVARQPRLRRFFSYQVIKEPLRLPGEWSDGCAPPPETVHHSWDRVSELWYESFTDWRLSVIDGPPHYTAPAWATSEHYPFVEPFTHFVSSFILERPSDEFLRDLRAYLP